MQCFEDGNCVAALCQVACAGQRCGAGAYNCYLVAVGFGLYDFNIFLSVVVVSNETFDTADCNGFAFDAAVAELFALVFLGADTAANCGQAGVQRNDTVSFIEFALFSSLDESGDVQVNRAALAAVGDLAVQAASSFVLYLFNGVAQSNFVEVTTTNDGVLAGHGVLNHRHICHNYSTSFLNRLHASS